MRPRIVTIPSTSVEPADRDAEVWAEEDQVRGGPLVLPNIRDPRILARVRQGEADRVARLEVLLISKGLHISQIGNRWLDNG